ncbi:Bug family tripartite tricarboxylate transporter substrate binding protein [Pigmentiphaga kullae]|uniref:Tripartite-type tricarboxylate transporter receptor subunit TctC n=1 Tax=Pigmentiphaga kullae TaxID=151784 RepID=A0A4Q7NJ15_9BURK|nr:tripartite tricarboxylate transporter substrate binding protein [Pigmentiphaga kullae]RZS84500.1 tripartite-type tricarboxylate transporter receptor subunit TctC [Pigmentiphaga kullae]
METGIRSLRRRWAAPLAALAAWTAAALPVAAIAAQNTITIVVASSPGTGPDILARTVSQQWAAKSGTAAVVDNRPGASGNIGADHVARSRPDGSTLLMAATTFATNAAVNRTLPYDPVKDFAPIALLGTGTLALAVPPSFPAETLKQFVARAKAAPGTINYGSPGNGTPQHLAMELFKQEAHIDLFHVPFKSAGGAVNDLAGGHVSAMIVPLHTIQPLVQGGKLRVLAVMSAERAPSMPQVPTFREEGYDQVQVDVWYGLLAPAGTPDAVVRKLNAEANEALKNKDVVASLAKVGIEPAGGTPARMADTLALELKRWPPVVRAANITAD